LDGFFVRFVAISHPLGMEGQIARFPEGWGSEC